jgi:thioredoxin-like negative regulator of GroEL
LQTGHLKLVKVDVDKSPAPARRFDVQSIPTLLLIHGQVVSLKLELRRPARSRAIAS